MAVVNTWTASVQLNTGNPVHPAPYTLSLQVPVANTAGNWLLLVAGIQDPILAGTTATVSVSDDVHNWWEPAFPPQATSSASGNIRVSAWIAPAAQAAANVMIAPTSEVSTLTAIIFEVSGQTAWVDTGAINTFANSATSLSAMAFGVPPSSSFFVTAAACFGSTPTLSVTGTGWSAVTNVSILGQTKLAAATQTSAVATSATWSTGIATTDLAGVTFFCVQSPTALVPKSPNWPVVIMEAAIGSGFLTNPDQMVWAPLTSSFLQFSMTQGRQYETAQLAAGEGTLYLDNPVGQLVPGQSGYWQVSFTGDGVTANPGIASTSFTDVTGGVTYTFNALVNLSAAYASGLFLQIDWRDNTNTHISFTLSSSATAAGTTSLTASGPAPATAVSCVIDILAGGTPPSSLIMQAAASPGSTITFSPSSTAIWHGFSGATLTTLLPWNAYNSVTVGTPVRLRTNWGGGIWQVAFHGNGVAANAGVSTNKVFNPSGFVTAGQFYAATVYVAAINATWASGMNISITWFNGSLGVISTITSANVPITPEPALLSISGYAPGTAVFANLNINVNGTPASSISFVACAGPPVPNGHLLTNVAAPWGPVNSATITGNVTWTPQVAGPPQATPWNIPYSGYIERLPQRWDPNLRGYTEATITDYWFACNFQPQPVLIEEVLNDLPYAYWTCGDGAGSTVAANFAPDQPFPGTVSSLPLKVQPSKYSTTGFTETFGGNSPTSLLGAQNTLIVSNTFKLANNATLWEQTIPNPTANEQFGFCLTCSDINYPPVTGGVTIEFWFQAQPPNAPGYAPALIEIGNAANGLSADFWSINLNAGGVPAGALTISGSYANNNFFSTVNYYTNPPLTHVAITFNQANYTTYVNGVATGGSTAWVGTLPNFDQINVGGSPLVYVPNVGFEMNAFGGFIGHVAIFGKQLSAGQIWNHYQAGAFAMAGEPCFYRIERLLNAGNALGRRAILQDPAGTSTPVVSMQDTGSQPMSQSLMNVTNDLLPGMFYVAPTGDLFYLEKAYAYNQPVKWALGDEPYNGEIPYSGDIAYEFDPSRIINQIQLTQLDSETITTSSLTAVETASQAQYGTLTYLATGYLQNDASSAYNAGPGLLDLANWLATAYDAPALRLTSITLDASAFPSSWPAILGISIGDMVTIARRPPGGEGEFIFITGRVTQTQRDLQFSVRGVAGGVKLMIDSAPEEFALTLDDTTRGLLNGTNVLGW